MATKCSTRKHALCVRDRIRPADLIFQFPFIDILILFCAWLSFINWNSLFIYHLHDAFFQYFKLYCTVNDPLSLINIQQFVITINKTISFASTNSIPFPLSLSFVNFLLYCFCVKKHYNSLEKNNKIQINGHISCDLSFCYSWLLRPAI